MVYELEFWIGNTKCILVDVQPFNTRVQAEEKYFEHCHPCFEFHYVEEGNSTFLCDKRCISVSKNQILIIPPRMYHQEIASDDNTMKMTISIDIASCTKSADDNYFSSIFQRDETLCITANASLKEQMQKIKQLVAGNSKLHTTREKLRASAHLFIAELYDKLSNTSPKCTVLPNDSTLSREYTIDTHLALNFMSNSSKDNLAKKLHVSPRQLHRIMIKSYGKGYREKLLELRLENALSFLTSTNKSISEISEELGYSSVESFSIFIKKATGKTPSQIRKAARDTD